MQLGEVGVDLRRDVPRHRLAVENDRIDAAVAGLGRPATCEIAYFRSYRVLRDLL